MIISFTIYIYIYLYIYIILYPRNCFFQAQSSFTASYREPGRVQLWHNNWGQKKQTMGQSSLVTTSNSNSVFKQHFHDFENKHRYIQLYTQFQRQSQQTLYHEQWATAQNLATQRPTNFCELILVAPCWFSFSGSTW